MKIYKRWKKLAVSAVLLAVAVVLGACGNKKDTGSQEGGTSEPVAESEQGSEELKPVRIGYPGNNGCASNILGFVQVNGMLEEELNKAGYTAVISGFETGGAGINEALASGQLDLAVYVDFPALVGHSNGIDDSVISVIDSVTEIAIVAKDDSIQNIEDLEGKKIGVQIGTVQQRFIGTALESVGLSVQDVEILNMTAAESAVALNNGDIDAFAGVELNTVPLEKTDSEIHVVIDTRVNSEWSSPMVMVGINSFLGQEPDAAVAVIKALLAGKEASISDPELYYQSTADAQGMDYELQEYIENHDNNAFATREIEVTDTQKERIERDLTYALTNGLIDTEFDVDTWIDNSYYEKAVN